MLGMHSSMLGMHSSMLGMHSSMLGMHSSLLGMYSSMLGMHSSVSRPSMPFSKSVAIDGTANIFASGLIAGLKSTSRVTHQLGRVALLMKLGHHPSALESIVLTNSEQAPQQRICIAPPRLPK